ncbi:hypothetical protein PLICRDRAFT_180599 [Plicaturopsis crispa FD-325 SS-3]|uniref:Uncharacterized protein n=1 Tax=Plicaturopsis crispa FD-325 SS-3 TaxID=944288 RepID=A0A0C9SK65_PLICR|nr:hypothetical protein PLICRDRAFT_180599 [Plicaturopsis crispa FD-325 SS-3]
MRTPISNNTWAPTFSFQPPASPTPGPMRSMNLIQRVDEYGPWWEVMDGGYYEGEYYDSGNGSATGSNTTDVSDVCFVAANPDSFSRYEPCHTVINAKTPTILNALPSRTHSGIARIRELQEESGIDLPAALSNSSGRGPEVPAPEIMVWPRKPAVSPNLTSISNTSDGACAYTSSEVLRIWGISDIKPDGEYFTVATSARYQQATLIGPSGERTPVLALVDGGASRNVIDKACFERIAPRLAPLKPGTNLKSAGDFELHAFGAWEGYIDTAGVAKWMQCEVIDLKGAVDMILGRPWLRDTKTQHDYGADTITVSDTNRTATLYAQHRESVLRKRRNEGLPTIPEGDEPHDNPEQATAVLPHRPSEDLPATVPTEVGQCQSWSGCADVGYCVPDPSRSGPRSTSVAYVDVAPPPNSTLPPASLCTDNADAWSHIPRASREGSARSRPRARVTTTTPLFGSARCGTASRWALLAVDEGEVDEDTTNKVVQDPQPATRAPRADEPHLSPSRAAKKRKQLARRVDEQAPTHPSLRGSIKSMLGR